MNVIEIQDRDIYIIGDIHGEFHIAYARDGIKHACIILAGDCGFGFHHFKYYTECMYRKAEKWLERNETSSSAYAVIMMTLHTSKASSSMKSA